MEEAKAAAYYDELNRKGEGARRFKQGLGFSSNDPGLASFPSKPTTTTSSFLSSFVRAGATPSPSPAQPSNPSKPPPPPEPPSRARRRSRSPSPSRLRRRSRSRSPSRYRRRRPRSRSRERRRRSRSRSRSRERGYRRGSRLPSRSRSRSLSPSPRTGRSSHSDDRRDRHGDWRRDSVGGGSGGRESSKGRGGRDADKVDYRRLVEGYDKMTPAERVKAKMKLQLSETASKDSTLGTATVGWERFEFNKDAPLDEDDDDVQVASDDASLVKHIGKSFRLSAVESKHEDIVRDAHDDAIFGVPASSIVDTESENELKTNDEGKEAQDVETRPSSSLVSDKVLAMQKGSWRERTQKLRQDSNS